MRKIMFSAAAAVIILVACSKGSDKPVTITGTWQVNKIYANTYLNNQLQEADTVTKGSITFNNDGSFTAIDQYDSTSSGTYSYNASTKILYSIQDMDSTSVNVTSLTGSDLHYTGQQSQNYGGTILKITIDADYRR